MKWFKHQARASEDEKISEFEDRFGMEAYAFYFKVLEIISSEMGDSDCTKVSYSIKKWKRKLPLSTKKLTAFFQLSAKLSLFSCNFTIENGVNYISADAPNLLKYRDEYSRKKGRVSGQTTDSCQESVAQELDKELELDKEKKNIKKKSEFDIEFESFWPEIKSLNPGHNQKGPCLKVWVKIRKKCSLEEIMVFYRGICSRGGYGFFDRNMDPISIKDFDPNISITRPAAKTSEGLNDEVFKKVLGITEPKEIVV